jgi:hypothetical protein
MLLGFPKVFPGKRGRKTHFKEKVLAGKKIHILKEDRKNTWRAGDTVHFAYGVRSGKPQRWGGKQVITSVQTVSFKYPENGNTPEIFIDGRRLGVMEMLLLAANDGFETLNDFLAYYNTSLTWKLIHWTKFTYDGDLARLDTMQRAPQPQREPTFPPGGVHINGGPEFIVPASKPGAHTMTVSPEWLAERSTLQPVPYPKANEWAIDTEGGNDAWKVFAQSEDKEMQKRFQNLRIDPLPGVPANTENMVYSFPVKWEPLGIEEGAICNRDGCTGKIAFAYEGEGCTCFNNPPCNYCLSSYLHCPTCGWDELEESDGCHGLNEDLQAGPAIENKLEGASPAGIAQAHRNQNEAYKAETGHDLPEFMAKTEGGANE